MTLNPFIYGNSSFCLSSLDYPARITPTILKSDDSEVAPEKYDDNSRGNKLPEQREPVAVICDSVITFAISEALHREKWRMMIDCI